MRFCLKVLFAAVLLSLSAGTSSARNDVPLCETSTGKPGRLFEKMFGYLSVPTAFDEAKMNEDVGRIAPSVLSELGPLVIPENTGIDVVQFYDQGRVVFACSISVVSFNYGDDDLSSISEGDCGWIASRSLPLLSGLAQHIELPERFNEVAVGDPEIADLSPLTDQSIYVRGMTPGVTLVITVDRGGKIISQCPIIVEDADGYFAETPIDDAMLCRDETGAPAHLQTGQSVDVTFDEADKPYTEVAVADPEIADVEPRSDRKISVTAVSKGITNVITLAENGQFHHDCMIVVE